MPGPSAQYSPQPPQPYTHYPSAPSYPQSHYSQVPPGPRYPDAESYASRPEHYDESRTYVDPRYHQPERYAPNDSYAGPQGPASASAEPSRYGESQDYRQAERARPRGSSSASSSSSTSSSFLNISAKSPRFGGVFSTFFRAPSEQRKKRRRKKQMARILTFGNSSSSSVNSDLAYGRGYIERDKSQGPTPKPSAHPSPAMYRSEPVEPRQQPPAPAPAPRSKTDEEILEIGRQLQDIARRQNDADLRAAGRSRTSQLAGAAAAAAAVSHFSRKSKSNSKARGTGTSKPSDLGSSSDDDWESASDDDSSEDSSDGGLAYGAAFKPSKSARISSEPPEQIKPPERKSTVVDPRLFGPYNSLRGAVKSPCGFGEEDPRSAGSSRRHHEETVAQVESPKVTGKEPMQRVYPVPTSDPDRFDFDRSSITSSRQGLPQQSRPAPVPLQQPIPIVPVSSKVYDAERFVEEEPRGPRKPYQPSNGRSAAETAIAGVGVAAAAIGAAMASNRRESVEYLERRDDRPSELRDRRGDDRESRDVRISEERADRPARIELEDREVPNRHDSRRSTRHSEVIVVDDRGKRHAARDDISRESLKRQASTASRPEDRKPRIEDRKPRIEDRKPRIEDRKPRIEDRKPRIEDRQPRIEDRKPEVIEERQHAKRTEKPSESTRQFHGVEKPEAPITQAPIDPFQFQVADDAFQTPKYATPKTATPKRPLTPKVVTVDREPNFDDSPPRKPDYSDSRMSRKDSFELEQRLEQYQQGFRDRSRTPESHHRSHSLEEQEHAAKSIYDEAKHATAPVDAAAFASAIAVEEERSKRHRNDHVTEDGSRDRSQTARDTVQEEADKYYRETILARKIAADEIRSRSVSPHDQSVVGKWDDHEAPEIVTIRTPPEMDHPHDKSPYDAPDADVRIDNVIIPEELNRFLLADRPLARGAVSVFRSRDPSCERDRPLLNLVLPTPLVTPRPTPAPEKQREVKPADESRESTDSRSVGADASSVDSARHPEVILGPKGEVIERPTTPTAKSVTWGENETKSFVVESPEPPKNSSSGSSPKSTKYAKSKKRLGKSSPWGIIAAAIGGSGAAAATAAPEVRDPFEAQNDKDNQQKTGEDEEKHSPPQSPKSRAVEPSSPNVVAASPKLVTSFDDDLPPAPGPKPSSPRMSQMPGTFADDLEFASVLAAGLQDSGFDPNIVIDNPAYIRRDSPPGQNEPALYQQPFAETVTDLGIYPPDHVRHSSPVRESGYVIGEVPETPDAEKHVHDDDTSHVSLPREYRDKGKAREIPVADEEHIADAFEPTRKLSKKEKRKQKAAKRQSLDDVSGDFTSDIPEAPLQPPEAPYSRVVPDYDRHYSYADRSQSPETVVAIDTKSRSLDDFSSGNRPPSLDGPSVARPTTSEAASAEWETSAPTKVSKKQKKKNRASKSDVILVQEYDERPQEEIRPESRNSRAEPPESPAHVSTDPPETGDDTRSTPAKKKKSKKSKQSSDEWTDVEKQIDDTPTSERSRSAAAFDDWDDRPAKSRRDRTKSEDREVSSVVSDPASRREKERSDRRSNGTRYEDGDDVKSVASDGTSRSKRRSRDEKKSSKDEEKRSSGSFFSLFRPSSGSSKDTSGKDEKSFLDNAGTLGAGAGLASAMAALGSMMSRSNAIEPRPEESSDVLSLRERSASPSRDVDILDPEITQRAIRPAIDPQYGDLLPLPPSPMPPSSPGSPTQELEELPALPDSRPETPPDERRRQHEMKTHVRRRSNLETPTKSPSQTAVPFKLRLGQRSTPSSPGNIGHAISPVSPPTAPAVPEVALAKRPSRPISWESSREIKPLYLLEHARQEHAAQLPELPIDFPELPPSEPSSRESPAPEFALPQDDVSYFNQLQASPFEPDLRIDTDVYHFPRPDGHYGSQETTPKAEQASQHTVAVLGPPSPALPVAPNAARQMDLSERELIDLPALPASPVPEPNPADLPALPSSPLNEYDISDSPAMPASTVDELASLPVLPSSLPTEREIMGLPALPESPVAEHEPESMPTFPVVPNGTMDELADLPIPPSSPPTETMDLPALPDSPGTGYEPESMPALPAVPTGIRDELVRLPLALSSPPTEAMDLLPPLPESPGTGYEPESMPALPAVPADTLVQLDDLSLPPFVPLTEREEVDLPALPDSPVIAHQPEDMPALPVDPLVEHDLAYLPTVSRSAVDEHTQPDLPLLDTSTTVERVVQDVADDPTIPTTPHAEKELPISRSFKPESPALPTLADAKENINFFDHELEYLPALPASPLTELAPAELPLGTVFGPESPALPSLPDAAQLDVFAHELGDLPALPASPEISPVVLSEPPAALPTSIMFGSESPALPTLPDAAQLDVSEHELEDLPALPASPEVIPTITSEPPADLPTSTVYGPESPALPTLSNAAQQLEGFEHELGGLPALPASPELIPTITSQPPAGLPPSTVYGPESPALPTLANAAIQLDVYEHELGDLPALPASPEVTPIITAEPDLVEAISTDRSSYLLHKTPTSIIKNLIEHDLPDTPPSPSPSKPQEVTDVIPELEEEPQLADPEVAVDELARAAVADLAAEVLSGVDIVEGQPAEVEPETRTLETPETSEPPAESKKSKKAKKKKNKRLSTQNSTVPPLDTASSSTPQEKDEDPLPTEAVPSSPIDTEHLFSSVATAEPPAEEPLPPSTKEDIPSISTNQEESPLPQDVALPVTPTEDVSHSADLDRVLSLDTIETGSAAHADSSFAEVVLPAFSDKAELLETLVPEAASTEDPTAIPLPSDDEDEFTPKPAALVLAPDEAQISSADLPRLAPDNEHATILAEAAHPKTSADDTGKGPESIPSAPSNDEALPQDDFQAEDNATIGDTAGPIAAAIEPDVPKIIAEKPVAEKKLSKKERKKLKKAQAQAQAMELNESADTVDENSKPSDNEPLLPSAAAEAPLVILGAPAAPSADTEPAEAPSDDTQTNLPADIGVPVSAPEPEAEGPSEAAVSSTDQQVATSFESDAFAVLADADEPVSSRGVEQEVNDKIAEQSEAPLADEFPEPESKKSKKKKKKGRKALDVEAEVISSPATGEASDTSSQPVPAVPEQEQEPTGIGETLAVPTLDPESTVHASQEAGKSLDAEKVHTVSTPGPGDNSAEVDNSAANKTPPVNESANETAGQDDLPPEPREVNVGEPMLPLPEDDLSDSAVTGLTEEGQTANTDGLLVLDQPPSVTAEETNRVNVDENVIEQQPPPPEQEEISANPDETLQAQQSSVPESDQTTREAAPATVETMAPADEPSSPISKKQKKKGKKNQATEDKTPALTDSKPAEEESVPLKLEEETNPVHSTEDVHVEPVSESVTDTLTPVPTVKDVHEETSGIQPQPAEAESSIARGTEEATAASALTASQLSDDLPPSLVEGDNTVSEPAPADTEPPAETPLPEPSGKKKKKKRKSKGATSLSQLDDFISADTTPTQTPATETPPAVDTSAAYQSTVDTPTVDKVEVEIPATDIPVIETPEVEASAVDTSAVVDTSANVSALENSAVDSSAADTSAADTLAVETPVIETSTVQTSTINTPTIDTPEVDTSALDTPAVVTSVAETPAANTHAVKSPPDVDNSAIDPSAVETPAIKTPAVQTLTEPSTTETPVAETPAGIPLVETPTETSVVETPTEVTSIETQVVETPSIETSTETLVVETLSVETPAVETPTETSVIETPVVETPAVETPADETRAEIPVVKTPAADTPNETLAVEAPIEIPVVETRSIETPTENTMVETPEIPAIETSVVETPEIPVVETPAVETPAVETPAVETPAVETPAVETPAVETPAVETPAVETPAVETPAVETPAVETPAVETPAVETPAVETPTEASDPTSQQDAEDTPKEHEADIEKHGDTARTPEVPVKPSTDPAVEVDSMISPAEESSKSSKKSKKKKKNRLSVADSETATPVADDSPATAVPVSSHDTAPNEAISGGEKSVSQDPDVTEDQAQRQDITSPEHTKLEDGPSATNNEAEDPTPAEGRDEAFVTPAQGPIVINDGEEASVSLSREPTLVESQSDAATAEKPAAENQESTAVEVPTDLETMSPTSSKKSKKKKGKKAAALEAEVDETSRDLDGTEEAKDETTESRTDTTSDKTGEMAQASREPHASGEFATDSKISEEADPGPAVTKKGKKKKKGKKSSTLDPEPENSPSTSTLETTADVANTMDKSAYIISPRGEPGSDEFPLPQADASTEAAWPVAANTGKKRKSVTWAPELESLVHGSELPWQDGDDKALESAGNEASTPALEQQPTMEHSQTRDQPQSDSPQPTWEEESGSERPPATTDVDQAATPVAEKDVDMNGQTPASELGDRTLPRPHDIHPSDYFFPSPAGLNRRGFGRGYFPSAHRMLLSRSSSSASDADVANRKGGETLQQMAGSEADATLDAEHAGRAHAIDKPQDAPANTNAQTGEVGVTDPGLHADVESASGVECDKSLQDTPNGRTADAQSVGPALTDSALGAGDPLNTPVQALANQDTNPEIPLQALDLAPSPSPSPVSPQVVKKSDAGYTDTAETRSGEDNDNDTPGPSLQKPEHREEKPQEEEKDGSSPRLLATDAPVPDRLETSESPGEPIAAEPHLLESPLETLPHLGLGPAGVPTNASQSPDQTENEPGPGAGSTKMSKKDKKKAKKAAALSAAQDDDVQDTAAPGGDDEALAVQSVDSAPAPAEVSAASKAVPVTDLVEAWAGEDAWAIQPKKSKKDKKKRAAAALAGAAAAVVAAKSKEPALEDPKPKEGAHAPDQPSSTFPPGDTDTDNKVVENENQLAEKTPAGTSQLSAQDVKTLESEDTPQPLSEPITTATADPEPAQIDTKAPSSETPEMAPSADATAMDEPPLTQELSDSPRETDLSSQPTSEAIVDTPSALPEEEYPVVTKKSKKDKRKKKKKEEDASFEAPEEQGVVTNAQDLPEPSSVEKAGDATPSPDIVDASGPREEPIPDAVVTTGNTQTLQQEIAQDVTEQKSADEAPAEKMPADEKPVDEKPAEKMPADEKPVDEKPAEEKPADEKPVDEEPAEEKPVEESPTQDKPAGEKFADEKLAKESSPEQLAREQIVEEPTEEEEYAAISKKTKKDKKKEKAVASSEESPALAVAEPDVTPVLATSPESPKLESLETTTNEKPIGSDEPVEQTTVDSEQVPAREDVLKESTLQALDNNDAPQPETSVDPEDEFPAVRKKSKKDKKKGKKSQADSVAEPLSQPASQNEPEVQSSEAAFTDPVPSAALPVPEGVSADRDPTIGNLPISGDKTDDQDVAKDPTDVEAIKPRNSDDLSAREENPDEKEKRKGPMTELEPEMRALPSSSTESAIDSTVPPASESAPFADQPLNEMIVPTAEFQPTVSTPQDADIEEEFPLPGKKAKKSKTKKNKALELTEPETEPQRTVESGTEPSSETKSDAASPAERTIEQPSGTNMPVDPAEHSAEQPEAVTQSDKTTTTDTVQEVENPSQGIADTGPTSGSEEAMTVNAQQYAEVDGQAHPAVDNEPSEPKLSKKDKKKKKAKLQDVSHPDSGTATPKTLEIPEDSTLDSQGVSKDNDDIPSSDILQIADAISSDAQAPPTDAIAATVQTPEVDFMPSIDNHKDQEHLSLLPKNLQEESQVPEPTAPQAEAEAPITTKRSKKDKKKKKGKSVDESAISLETPQSQPAEREEQPTSHVASVENTPVVDKKDTDSLNADVPGEALADDSVKASFQPPVEPSVEPPVEPPFDFSTETNVNNSDSVREKSMSTKSEDKNESRTKNGLGVNTGTSDPLEDSHSQGHDSNKPQDTLDQITLPIDMPIDSTKESPLAVADNTIPKTATPDTGESQIPTMPLQDAEWILPTKTSKKDKKKKKSRAKNDLEENVGSAMPLEIPAELPKENATPFEDTTTAEEVKAHTEAAVQKPFLLETGSSEEPHATTPGDSTSQHPSETETDEREPTKTVPEPVQAEPENTTEEDVIIGQPQECMVRNRKKCKEGLD
ncbi:involucrin repeat protein [Colletotrichum musicola]|uniref:Involucrin repeat protein n=1 Tax=Colletotrichum musicola TaxID=2175873 RepID=A0A8H6KB51_9PEZI|nr:involucrin repeat protein [Colletotrichum musicola]